jgi:hypothetical protein
MLIQSYNPRPLAGIFTTLLKPGDKVYRLKIAWRGPFLNDFITCFSELLCNNSGLGPAFSQRF